MDGIVMFWQILYLLWYFQATFTLTFIFSRCFYFGQLCFYQLGQYFLCTKSLQLLCLTFTEWSFNWRYNKMESFNFVCTGAKARNGAPIMTFPDRPNVPEPTEDEYRKVVTYLCSIPPWVVCQKSSSCITLSVDS